MFCMMMKYLPEFVKASIRRVDKALLAAKLLIEKKTLEDDVSRAHYAMFYVAQQSLCKGVKSEKSCWS